MQRVVIVGTTGSGKTTLGRRLREAHDLPFTDLDELYWRPGWQPAPLEEFRRDVDRVTRAPRWVVAGNYVDARDLIWPRADTLVWLDLPLPLTLWRCTRRVVRHAGSGEVICNGNRQSLGALFFGKDPLLWYSIKMVPRRRREWPAVLARAEHVHLRVVRLRSAHAVTEWMAAA